jgi:two-component system sensor kinase FixL
MSYQHNGRQLNPADTRTLLAAIVESSDDAIISTTLDGIVLSWNRAAQRMFQYSAEEMVGRPVFVIESPNHPGEMRDFLEMVCSNEPIQHYETERRRKDGVIIPVLLSVSPVRDEIGDVIGASKILRDISETKGTARLVAALTEEADELAYALDLAPVFLRSLDGTIHRWTRGAQALYGWTADEAVNSISHELLRTHFPEPLEQINATLQRTGMWTGRLVHHRKADGDVTS